MRAFDRLTQPAIAAVLALLATLGGVAACSRSDGPTQGSGSASRVELQFWTLALAPFEDYIRERIAAFEAENPGVKVVWSDVPYEAIDRKLMAAAAAGRAPDLVNMADRTFARFVAMDAMVDLKPLLPGDVSATYLSGALRLPSLGDRLLGLPWYLTTQTVLLNEPVLTAGGLTPATLGRDWRTLQRQSLDFHERTGNYLFSIPLGFEADLPFMMLADGVVPFTEDRSGPQPRLRANLLDPAVVAFLEGWVATFRSGAMPAEAVTGGNSHQPQLYKERRLALINTGPNFLKQIQRDSPTVFQGTQVEPAITGSLNRAHIAVMVLSVTNQSRNPELAARLAWFMTSAQSQLLLCRRAVVLPSVTAALEDPLFAFPSVEPLSDPAAEAERRIQYARALSARALRDAVAFTPSLEAWPDLRRAFEDGFKRVLLDGRDLRATLQDIQTTWDGILALVPGTMDAVPRPAAVPARQPPPSGQPSTQRSTPASTTGQGSPA